IEVRLASKRPATRNVCRDKVEAPHLCVRRDRRNRRGGLADTAAEFAIAKGLTGLYRRFDTTYETCGIEMRRHLFGIKACQILDVGNISTGPVIHQLSFSYLVFRNINMFTKSFLCLN